MLGWGQAELGFEIHWQRRCTHDVLATKSRRWYGRLLILRKGRLVSIIQMLEFRARRRKSRQIIFRLMDVWLLRLALCEVDLLSTEDCRSAQSCVERADSLLVIELVIITNIG